MKTPCLILVLIIIILGSKGASSLIPDNGSYTLGNDITRSFPENGYVLINISRKNEKRVKKGLNQEFFILAASYSSGVFDLESGRYANK